MRRQARHDKPRARPSGRHHQRITSSAIPPVQRMTRSDPRHAERVRPIGEQMHDAAARKPEQRRRGRIMSKPMISSGEQRNPRDTPMRRRTMRDPQSARARPPRHFEPIRRSAAGYACAKRNRDPHVIRPAGTRMSDDCRSNRASGPSGRMMRSIRSHPAAATSCTARSRSAVPLQADRPTCPVRPSPPSRRATASA